MAIPSRGTLDRQMRGLSDNILRLASMVDLAIDNAMTALDERNLALAQQVIDGDEAINELRYELEHECQLILATQQPTAGDLRTILTTIYMTIELERMADHASGIARLVARLGDEPDIDSLHKLPKMAKRARKMTQKAIQAYLDQDAEMAESIVSRDEKMDKHYNKLFRETLEEMRDEDYVRRATFLLWVGHNLERIGDRAVNMAERVIFMTTGRYVENEVIME
jgi:phosphate transport system protein